jgi:hypothetical protein
LPALLTSREIRASLRRISSRPAEISASLRSGDYNLDLAARRGNGAFGDGLQAISTAGDQDQVITPARQTIGVDGPDPAEAPVIRA